MRIEPIEPPRKFSAAGVELDHCANVELAADEQITLVSSSGTEYDIVRKSWGYYATSSMNRRLAAHGLRAALTVGTDGKIALLLVECGHEPEFEDYLDEQRMRLVTWLDTDDAVAGAVERLEQA